MADTILQEAILHGDLIVRVNTARPPYDIRKLPSWLDADFAAALASARAENSATQLAAGDQAGARGRVKQARDKLAGLVRNASSHIGAVPEEDATEEDKMDALVSLGYEQGQMGQLADATHLAQIVDDILANNGTLPPLLRLPAGIITRITNWRGVLTANEEIAAGGPRAVLTDRKDAAKALLQARIARVRLYLCSCSDLGEGDPEIARQGFQPKRAPGDAQPQPKPDAAGTVSYDAASRTLSVAVLPDHATQLVAWRQPVGGTAEPSGMSDSTSVDAAETAPFVPGAAYDLWVTGRNSSGDGAPSNKIRWTAAV